MKRTFLAAVSAKGVRVRLVSSSSHQLPKVGSAIQSGDPYLLASRAGLAFYRMGEPGGNCYAVGDANAVGAIGTLACWDGTTPIMDYSVYEVSKQDPSVVHVVRAAGIAADPVKSVAFTTPEGEVIDRMPVISNVYTEASPPMGPVAGIVAFGDSGERIFIRSFPAAA